MLRRRLAHRCQIATGDIHGLRHQARVELGAERHVAAGAKTPDPGRIPGYVGFGKHDQHRTVRLGLGDTPGHLLEGGGTIEVARWLLDDSDSRHDLSS